jgi:hypothetical protein
LQHRQAVSRFPSTSGTTTRGAGASGDYDLPILGSSERKRAPGANIYPFNPVTVDWFVKKKRSSSDDVIIVPELIAADQAGDGDFTVTADDLAAIGYRQATLVRADMKFSINH